jgi:hypothetical protein
MYERDHGVPLSEFCDRCMKKLLKAVFENNL